MRWSRVQIPLDFFLLFRIKMLQLFFLYLFLLVYCLFIICLDIFLCMTRLDLSKNSKIFFMSWNEKVLSNVCVFIFIRSPSPPLPSPPLPSPPLPSPPLPLPLVTERIHSPFQPKQSPSYVRCTPLTPFVEASGTASKMTRFFWVILNYPNYPASSGIVVA